MKLKELDAYFRSFLDIDGLKKRDISLNGIQVETDREINKIAFAVDACLEVFRRAKEAGAEMLFVHHGIFWGHEQTVTGSHYLRIKFLIENGMALYAAHLPLDIHDVLGNTVSLAKAAGLTQLEPFGEYRGISVGVKGIFPSPLSVEEIIRKAAFEKNELLSVLPFGKEKNRSAAVISGGGDKDVLQAVDEDADVYITGSTCHEIYHTCLENKINMISAGHYRTEIYGVKNLKEKVKKELGLETLFIDVPTGL